MALLLILLALVGFVFAGISSGSSGPTFSGTLTAPPPQPTNGSHTTTLPLGSKCSKHMHAEPASSRCRPPANP